MSLWLALLESILRSWPYLIWFEFDVTGDTLHSCSGSLVTACVSYWLLGHPVSAGVTFLIAEHYAFYFRFSRLSGVVSRVSCLMIYVLSFDHSVNFEPSTRS